MKLEELAKKSFVMNLGQLNDEDLPYSGDVVFSLKSVNPNDPVGAFAWNVTFSIGAFTVTRTILLNE